MMDTILIKIYVVQIGDNKSVVNTMHYLIDYKTVSDSIVLIYLHNINISLNCS
jgi:hypothetical protein